MADANRSSSRGAHFRGTPRRMRGGADAGVASVILLVILGVIVMLALVGRGGAPRPARAFRSDEVRIISQALERVSTEELCARFDPDAMRAAEVYPDIWESPSVDDGPLLFLTQHLEDLRGALRTLVARQRGLVVTLS